MSFDSGYLPKKPLRFRDQLESDKQQSLFFFSVVAFGFALAVLSVIGGFIYGDYYGRQHAQYDNPRLREYYSGQCFNFINNNLKKTMKVGIDKIANHQEQNQKLEEIRGMISSLQYDLGNRAPPPTQTKLVPARSGRDGKKKVAATR